MNWVLSLIARSANNVSEQWLPLIWMKKDSHLTGKIWLKFDCRAWPLKKPISSTPAPQSGGGGRRNECEKLISGFLLWCYILVAPWPHYRHRATDSIIRNKNSTPKKQQWTKQGSSNQAVQFFNVNDTCFCKATEGEGLPPFIHSEKAVRTYAQGFDPCRYLNDRIVMYKLGWNCAFSLLFTSFKVLEKIFPRLSSLLPKIKSMPLLSSWHAWQASNPPNCCCAKIKR